jgi:hypothetical protein
VLLLSVAVLPSRARMRPLSVKNSRSNLTGSEHDSDNRNSIEHIARLEPAFSSTSTSTRFQFVLLLSVAVLPARARMRPLSAKNSRSNLTGSELDSNNRKSIEQEHEHEIPIRAPAQCSGAPCSCSNAATLGEKLPEQSDGLRTRFGQSKLDRAHCSFGSRIFEHEHEHEIPIRAPAQRSGAPCSCSNAATLGEKLTKQSDGLRTRFEQSKIDRAGARARDSNSCSCSVQRCSLLVLECGHSR